MCFVHVPKQLPRLNIIILGERLFARLAFSNVMHCIYPKIPSLPILTILPTTVPYIPFQLLPVLSTMIVLLCIPIILPCFPCLVCPGFTSELLQQLQVYSFPDSLFIISSLLPRPCSLSVSYRCLSYLNSSHRCKNI